jgi:hypothetical protein
MVIAGAMFMMNPVVAGFSGDLGVVPEKIRQTAVQSATYSGLVWPEGASFW